MAAVAESIVTLTLFAGIAWGFLTISLAAITADAFAAWLGAAALASGTAVTIAKHWQDLQRQQKIRDCDDRVQSLKEIIQESEELRKLERDRHAEAEKTFDAILRELRNEIEKLRDVIKSKHQL